MSYAETPVETDPPVRPTALGVIPENLPPALTALDRWVAWKFVPGGGKWRKVPWDVRARRPARVNDPASWAPFRAALDALARRRRDRPDGLGFVFAAADGLVGADLDRCRDPATGAVEDWAADVVRELDTYAEVSPSGTGVKAVGRGHLPPAGRRVGGLELYDDKRFFALTGHRLPGPADVADRADRFLALHGRLFPRAATPAGGESEPTYPAARLPDEDVLALLAGLPDGGKFARLLAGDWAGYASRSEADLALCGMLARAVGPDPDRIAALFGRSGLAGRAKWRRDDYREWTVGRAVEGLDRFPGQGRGQPEPGPGRPGPAPEAAVAGAVALAGEQAGVPANPFREAFALARRLAAFGPDPEPFGPAVRAYCDAAGRPFDEYWVRVLECWGWVRVAEGGGDWAWAARMAVEAPVEFLPGAGAMPNRAASLAYYLSTRNDPFPFPVEKVGQVMGMSAPMGSTVTRLLVKKGVVAEVKAADRHNGRAREFTFRAPVAAAGGGVEGEDGAGDGS